MVLIAGLDCRLLRACGLYRPAIHSDFIRIMQIFFLKFSEIHVTWLKIQIILALNLVEISL